jgi:hypothetical protein
MLVSLGHLKKLRRMPAREIAGRLASQWGMRRLERFARDPGKLTSRVAGLEQAVLTACQEMVPGSLPAQLQGLAENHPDEFRQRADGSGKLADAIVGGEYKLLGRPVALGSGLDWHADPATGFTWEQAFFGRVSYHRIPEHVDFKHVWELGRHQYVVELVRAWRLGGNGARLEFAQWVLSDWIANNPFCHGIHWTSGLEVAMRSISWIWTLAHGQPHFAGDRRTAELVGQLALHGHYLENHLSIYSSPYNHIIGEATALYLLGTVFGDSPDAERWKTKGRNLLHAFGPRQFYQDGFCVEQAVGYHYYTLGFLTLAMLAARGAGDWKLELGQLVSNGYRAGRALRQPDGNWPAIGDVDSASSIPVARANFWDFSSLHQLAAVALGEPSIGFLGSPASAETYWLLGVSGVDQWQAMQAGRTAPAGSQDAEARETNAERIPPATAGRAVTVLPQAGYFIAYGENDWLLLDAGPISAGLHPDGTPSAAHGHADTLQLLANWGGKAVLRDSGMPNYAGNPKRMDYFRSPAAHNSVTFDNAPLVRPAGRLAWSHDIAETNLQWSDDADLWQACGQVRWHHCSITRHILAIPGEAIWIADSLVTSTAQQAHWSWQLASDSWTDTDRSDRHAALSDGTLQMRTLVTGDALTSQLCEPDRDGCAGWYSPEYGVLTAGRVWRLQLNVSQSALVLTVLGTPQRKVGFFNDVGELWLPVEMQDQNAPFLMAQHRPADTTTLESRYESFGSGTWRLDA